MKTISVHYSSQDLPIGEKIEDLLEKSGYNVLSCGNIEVDLKNVSQRALYQQRLIDILEHVDLVLMLFSEDYIYSSWYDIETEIIFEHIKSNTGFIPIALDDARLRGAFRYVKGIKVSKEALLKGNLDEVTRLLANKETEMYQMKKEEAVEKEDKKEVVQRISDSPQFKKVISGLRVREWVNKGIAILCYIIGIAGIFLGAKLAYSSVSNIPSDRNSYYYIYIGAKNLAIIGMLILCSRYTFNIGKMFMEEGVKQADRLHAINYGKFFLESFQEKLSFEEMKELFKDWNMDNRPSPLGNPDPMATDPNITDGNGKSEAGIAVDLLTKLTDLLANQKK